MPNAGRLGDRAHAPADAHGCPACAHPVTGPAVTGSSDVVINFKAALRVGDSGIHAACCGPNTWIATEGASAVLINGMPAHRLGDATAHCGGSGHLIDGSMDVFIGDASPPSPWLKLTWVEIELHFEDGTPAAGEVYRIELPDGSIQEGQLDERGHARVEQISIGTCHVSFPKVLDTPWEYA